MNDLIVLIGIIIVFAGLYYARKHTDANGLADSMLIMSVGANVVLLWGIFPVHSNNLFVLGIFIAVTSMLLTATSISFMVLAEIGKADVRTIMLIADGLLAILLVFATIAAYIAYSRTLITISDIGMVIFAGACALVTARVLISELTKMEAGRCCAVIPKAAVNK